MKKKIVYVLVLVAFLVSATMGVSAADAPSSKNRSSLYSRSKATTPSSGVSSEIAGIDSPLRSGGSDLGLGDGIGTLPDPAPIGDATGIILLAGLTYIGFVFIRKRKELRTNKS